MSDFSNHDKSLYAKVGAKLKILRIKKGFSNQRSFAYEFDIPRAQYGRYEKGANITLRSLSKVLRAHNMSLEKFFKGF